MNISNAKKGMTVRIAKNIDITNETWSLTSAMRKMKGGIYKIYHVGSRSIRVSDGRGDAWTFSPEDLSIPEIKPSPPPVMFDPENIIE